MNDNIALTPPVRQGDAAPRAEAAVGDRLLPLAAQRGAEVSVHELADGRIVLVERDVVLLVTGRPAPDGEYALRQAGRVVVKAGRAVAVVGQPAATALTAPAE